MSENMQADNDTIHQWVDWLEAGNGEQQYQAALALRALAGDAGDKHLIREAGGIDALLRLLDSGNDNMLTVVAAESLSCLAADDPANRVSSLHKSILPALDPCDFICQRLSVSVW